MAISQGVTPGRAEDLFENSGGLEEYKFRIRIPHRNHRCQNEKFIAPPSSQTVKEADLGRVLSINHQFLKLQIYNPTKTLKRPISTTKIKH